MGNNFSNQSSDDTIGFRNTNINNYSSTLPGKFEINKDVSQVINNLPLPSLDNIQQGGNLNFSEESLGINDIFKKLEKNDIQNNDMSETSPFISSDMYNFLMKGGAKNKKTKGKEIEEQEEQEETSLTVDSSDESENKPEDKSSSSSSSSSSEKKETEDAIQTEDDELNYQSSSAHTESSDTEEEQEQPSQAPEISSVNTSDIKLITES